jgi:hypothetical protein
MCVRYSLLYFGIGGIRESLQYLASVRVCRRVCHDELLADCMDILNSGHDPLG